MIEWKNFFRGILIGATDLVPGVSGGTVAVILGIYDRLVAAISRFFSREWKKQLGFLIPLGVGMVVAIFALSHLIKWLLNVYPQPTFFFFIGLILGIVPYLLRTVNYKETFRMRHYMILVVSGLLLATTKFISEREAFFVETLNLSTSLNLFFSGWLASMAMLLPGISGSFVLVLLGKYETILTAISEFNIPIILITGAGIAVGFVVTSKFINFLFKTFPITIYSIIIGLLIGSIVVIFPGIASDIMLLIASLIAMGIGFYLAHTLGKYEH